MRISGPFLALAAGFVLASGASHAATWQSDLLNVQLLSPNPQTVAFNGNFTVPASNINIVGPTLPLSIGATSVTLQNTANATVGFQVSSLIKITDTTASPILNVQVDPASTITLFSSLVSGGNFMQFDLQDADIVPLGVLILDVTFVSGSPSPIPSPASLPLFASGLLSLAAVSWTKNKMRLGGGTAG